MTNTPRGEGPEPIQPSGYTYPAYPDPAYSGQPPYHPPTRHRRGPIPPGNCRRYGYDQYATGQYATGQYG